jgi:hypothetical protein
MSHLPKHGHQVVKRMAPRNSVNGANALDTIGGKLKKPRIGRIPKDTMKHSGRHPGFKAVARKIARKEHLPIERANAILAASSRRARGGGGSLGNFGHALARLPTESQVFGNKHNADRTRTAMVSDVPDLKTDKDLRQAVALMQANSPLDPENREHVGSGVILRHMKKAIRMPRLRPITKKGGMVFTTMKNLLVDPNSAERI